MYMHYDLYRRFDNDSLVILETIFSPPHTPQSWSESGFVLYSSEDYYNECSTGNNSAGVPYMHLLPPVPDADPDPRRNYSDAVDCAVDDACSRQCVENYVDKFRYSRSLKVCSNNLCAIEDKPGLKRSSLKNFK